MLLRLLRRALACVLFIALAGAALADPTYVQMTRQYQSVGVGPLAIGAVGSPLQYQIGDSQPQSTSVGFFLQPSAPLVQIPVGAQVWAEASGLTTGGAVVYSGSFGGIAPNPPITNAAPDSETIEGRRPAIKGAPMPLIMPRVVQMPTPNRMRQA